ncbi:MAG TPA: hypothetical protein VHB30_13185 [Solirubrobacteraceae bacterium]|jgi:hypothetical protein|nr:hypothetical protein [Solirubrobacteraceae bacterium]
MGALAWVMMAIAIWHFTIFIPDRFWGGIVGALLGAVVGGFLVALAINGFGVPGESETHIATSVDAIPGSLIGIAVVYLAGVRRGNAALEL